MKGNTTIHSRMIQAEMLYEEAWDMIKDDNPDPSYHKISEKYALICHGFCMYPSNVMFFQKDLPNNQVCMIWGEITTEEEKEMDLNIFVGDKDGEEYNHIQKYKDYKDENSMTESTGAVGISGLLLIWKQLPSLICWAKSIGIRYITGYPPDTKRKNAYKKLEKLGFVFDETTGEFIIDLKGGDLL